MSFSKLRGIHHSINGLYLGFVSLLVLLFAVRYVSLGRNYDIS
ncbi:hypothetical protein [uncultured Methanobrevibacter sp.]|nr:hypothetical protein [uncultured Methanobrevibacter sp.]